MTSPRLASAQEPAVPPEPQPEAQAAPQTEAPQSTPAPAQPATTPAASNHERLADPEVARAVGLSPEQQTAVAKIVAQRDAALAQAAETDRAAIRANADKELAALLNDEQRTRFIGLPGVLDAKRLKFSFRFQPWTDVLNWFAEQADLSLVLDAPPPGTFNYTDSREYSVPEAIDLLNGVLLTKGYTLLRRERMLMVLDLVDGVPTDLVPRISLDELDRRGRFELVSIVFPLGQRNAEEVKTEITPLLGPHGTTAILPKTRQILVTDTAGKMRSIRAVIESIPQPQASSPALSGAPSQPTLAVYPLAGLDAKATIDILSALFPDVKFVHDAKVDQLMAHTVPERQAGIQAVLAQLRAENPPDKKPRLQRHAVKQSSREQLLETLKLAVPEAVLRFDTETGELLAWANPAQQDAIARQIVDLGRAATPAAERQLEVHAIKKADPAAMLALLQKMLPEARLAVDAPTRSLIAFASPDEQQAIRATLAQLETHGDEKPTLQLYPLNADQRKRAQAILAALAADLPGIRTVTDAGNGELAVWAKPEQHPIIKGIIEQLARDVPEAEQFRVVAYRIAAADPASVLSVLQTLLPDVRFVSDTKAKQIVAWARAADQEKIAATVRQLDQDLPDDERLQLRSHPLREASADAVLAMVRAILPNVQLVSDTKASAVAAWASGRDHKLIDEAIAGVQPNTADEDRPRVVVYPVPDADPAQLAAMLITIVPTGRFSGDRTSGKLAAWGTPKEQEAIKTAVDGMLKTIPPDRQLTAIVYRPKSADVTTLVTDLRTLVPEARLTADLKQGALVAWATPTDHAKIRETIDGLDAEQSPARELTSVVYRPKTADVTTLLADLRALVPEARLTADAKQGALVAWATPTDHTKIRETIEGLDTSARPDNDRTVEAYSVAETDGTTLLGVLQAAVPDARLVPDAKSGAVLAWARPEQHELLKKALSGLSQKVPADKRRTAHVYRFRSADANAALTVLRSLVPTAQLAVDARTGSLAATALPSEHEQIAATVAQLEGDGAEATDLELRVYPVKKSEPASVLSLLRELFVQRPEVRISLDPKNAKLVAWALPAQHKLIQDVLERVDLGNAEDDTRQLEVHALGDANPQSVSFALSGMFPDVRDIRTVTDEKNGLLTVLAPPEAQAAVRAVIAQMQGRGEQLEVIPLEVVDPFAARESIERLFGDPRDRTKAGVPRVETDPDSRQLFIRASKEQLKQIRELLAKMGEPQLLAAQPGAKSDRRLRVIPLRGSAEAALAEVERLWPQLRKNPIRVVVPSAVAPTLRQARDEANSPDDAAPNDTPPPPDNPTPDDKSAPQGGPGCSSPGGPDCSAIGVPQAQEATCERIHTSGATAGPASHQLSSSAEAACASLCELNDEPATGWPGQSAASPRIDEQCQAVCQDQESDPSAKDEPSSENENQQPPTQQPEPTPPAESEHKEPAANDQKPPAPIIVSHTGDSITIASDDPEALDQFEQLLKAVAGRGRGGQDFTLFQLKRANAQSVAETLDNVLRGSGFGFRGAGGPTIVPDSRLNTIIVQANRNDLAKIEGLIRVLDSSEAPDTLVGARPRLIPVKNTDAERIALILRDVYKTQLTAGANRRQQALPQKLTPEMAAVVQQLNAASQGPEMTLGVDRATNSIVILAPAPLVAEVEKLVATLDEQSDASRPTVHVLALKRTNTKVVQKALEELIKNAARQRTGIGGSGS